MVLSNFIRIQNEPANLLVVFFFKLNRILVHVPNFGGLSGSEDRGGGDNSIQFMKFGGWVTKVLKNGDKMIGGWRGG